MLFLLKNFLLKVIFWACSHANVRYLIYMLLFLASISASSISKITKGRLRVCILFTIEVCPLFLTKFCVFIVLTKVKFYITCCVPPIVYLARELVVRVFCGKDVKYTFQFLFLIFRLCFEQVEGLFSGILSGFLHREGSEITFC